MPRPARVRLLVVGVALGLGAAAAAYFFWPTQQVGPPREPDVASDVEPPDPRQTFATRFRNVHPDVIYVGDAACRPCHKDLCDTFHRHPMGRSARLPDDPSDGLERIDAAARFTAFGHEYRTDRRGPAFVQTESVRGPDGKTAIEVASEVICAIGSGTRGRSYLTARDGALWQTGVSWFSEKAAWDTSPGFGPGQHALRPVAPGCLFCHVNRVEPVPGTLNRYKKPFFGPQVAIGCERCHGPGALHVADQTDGRDPPDGFDASIVNPKHLPADLREDVCRQCHFQGAKRVIRRGRGPFDYRPGLPLDLFVTVFVQHPDLRDYHKSVGQVEQLAISRCATAGDKFGCTSCHDPHRSPGQAEKANYYRERCLTCHQTNGCAEAMPIRQAVNDACSTCHMPRTASTSIAHAAVTDHRILRRPAPAKDVKRTLPSGQLPLTTIAGPGRHGPGAEELDRDLGIALASFVNQPGVGPEALRLLRAASARHARDAEASEALVAALLVAGELAEALRVAEAAVAVAPERASTLAVAADAALRARRLDRAAEYARRAVAADPTDPEHRRRLAQALADGEKWADAEAELRAALKQFPNHAAARADLALCLYQQGQARAARAELDLAVAIDPRQGPAVRAWFERRIR